MKIIFLDIDGVLNSQNHADKLYNEWLLRQGWNEETVLPKGHGELMRDGQYKDKYGVLFDPACVDWLRRIINETGAKIILSSDWRKSGIDTIRQMWEDRELPGEIIDVTPVHSDLNRANEIMEKVEEYKPKNWIAVDDMELPIRERHFVNTGYEKGITRTEYRRCRDKLNCETIFIDNPSPELLAFMDIQGKRKEERRR